MTLGRQWTVGPTFAPWRPRFAAPEARAGDLNWLDLGGSASHGNAVAYRQDAPRHGTLIDHFMNRRVAQFVHQTMHRRLRFGGRIPQQHIHDGSIFPLHDPAGPEARLAFQPCADFRIGRNEFITGAPTDELERRNLGRLRSSHFLRDQPCEVGRTISSFTSTSSGWLTAKPMA